jgi:hypothetical protein
MSWEITRRGVVVGGLAALAGCAEGVDPVASPGTGFVESTVRTVEHSGTLNELWVAGSVEALPDPDPPAIGLTPEAVVLAPGPARTAASETIDTNLVHLSVTEVPGGVIPIRFPAVVVNTGGGVRLDFRVSDLEDGAPLYGNVDASHVAGTASDLPSPVGPSIGWTPGDGPFVSGAGS